MIDKLFNYYWCKIQARNHTYWEGDIIVLLIYKRKGLYSWTYGS